MNGEETHIPCVVQRRQGIFTIEGQNTHYLQPTIPKGSYHRIHAFLLITKVEQKGFLLERGNFKQSKTKITSPIHTIPELHLLAVDFVRNGVLEEVINRISSIISHPS